jgi:hypothetical protein
VKIHQLSVFLENHPGALEQPVRALAEAGLNIDTLALADSSEFGILRLVIRDWRRALAVLQEAGCVVNVHELVAVEVSDHPGGLASVLAAVESAGVNVEYMYGFPLHAAERSALLIRFDDAERAMAALVAGGIRLLELEALATL